MTRNENKRKRAQIEAKRSKGAYHTMGISNVIALLSGVALFLFGMTLMGDGLKKVAGNKLELVLYKLSGNPIKGVLLGTGVTAIIQPGGSVRDDESIAACDEHGIAMVFTGTRHFRH